MLDIKSLDTQVAAHAQSATLDAVRDSASKLTLAELLKFASSERGSFLSEMTLGELGEGAKKGRGRPKGSGKVKAKTVASAEGAVDTRSKEAREQYRRMVLQVVQKNPGVSAQDIRAKAGGTEHQARTALNFHRKAGTITHEGATRNRVYSPVAS